MTELISINQAAAEGIERVRRPAWANSFDHIKIDIIDGKPGPWLHLWCPINMMMSSRDPVDMLSFGRAAGDLNEKCFVPYTEALPGSDDYKAAVERYLT